MNLGGASTLSEVALTVGVHLRRRGIRAVLTGGACVSIYTDGQYVSRDADYVIQGRVTQTALDDALTELGFVRDGDRYVHTVVSFYLEFPPGPLSIGSDLNVKVVALPFGNGAALALSATDSCRDRLAAFYHWRDRQSLALAVAVARRHRVNFRSIRTWSAAEGAVADYDEFRRELARASGPRNRGGRPKTKRRGTKGNG